MDVLAMPRSKQSTRVAILWSDSNPVREDMKFNKDDQAKELASTPLRNLTMTQPQCSRQFCLTKYTRVITMHWLDELPLWHCITGLATNNARNASKPFGRWTYSVRQIVALYHKDYIQWLRLPNKYPAQCCLVESTDDRPQRIPTAKLVAHVIAMLVRATYCRSTMRPIATTMIRVPVHMTDRGMWSRES
ncbi:hypothetical protein BU25DRAFT_95777 [Macroventuria anomochaeta]|uniref:Uncharacterized protein n=1 Tax=Macroventuria anomochaeta TaxID=301207 RepID=A0ACB6RX83_9PLEO|nr:uncharacterized protein BU25DRAFT_95777 [Macroventuria anomochaeta]KAF2626312.1 hypothetical protein BU25DRAFT_95777 [Macroventuria anomochaeta]